MALLISEDEIIKTSFEINFLKDKCETKLPISWIPYKLILQSAEKNLIFETPTANRGSGDYVIALKPVNEIENCIKGIKNFLTIETKMIYSFEPLEPSFELILERSHKGYSVTCWVDAGNVISDHYSWDGFGLRFFTTEEKINSFVSELSKEKEELLNVC